MKTTESISVTSQKETHKVGCFCDRIVDIGIAVGAIAAYMVNTPVLVIGFGVGSILVCRRLFSRSPVVITFDPISFNLKKLKSSLDANERFAMLRELARDFYGASNQEQIAILKAIADMLNDNKDSENGYKAIGEIHSLILGSRINNAEKLQTLIDGFTNFMKNPGDIVWENRERQSNKLVLEQLLDVVLPKFMVEYQLYYKEHQIELTQLEEALEDLKEKLPDGDYTRDYKQRINRALVVIRWQ